jgi:hypothetical protein
LQVASKTQARIITYSVIALNLAFVGAAIGLLAGQGTFKTVGDVSEACCCDCGGRDSKNGSCSGLSGLQVCPSLQLRSLYRAQLVLGSICLGLEALVLLWLASGVRRSKREQRIW